MSNLGKLMLCLLTMAFAASSQVNSFGAVPHGNAPVDSKAALSLGTTILAKLLTTLDAEKCKPGDAVEAEITRDVTQDHKVVAKKGSRLTGHVVGIGLSSDQKPQSRLGFIFDNISVKNGGRDPSCSIASGARTRTAAAATIRALRGRGTAATEITAGAATGGSVGGALPNGELRLEDSGVYGIPGLSLAVMTTDKGLKLTIVTSADGNVRLARGTQMALQVIGK